MTSVSRLRGARLTAATVELDPAVDLAAVAGDTGTLWERPHEISLAGWGVAARIPVPWGVAAVGPDVTDALGAIESVGPYPAVALGALPFWRSERAELTVPAVLVRRLVDGHCWLTVTSPDPRRTLDDIRRRLETPGPDTVEPGPRQYRVRSETDRRTWCRMVADAAAAVAAGRLAKVVLARAVTVEADEALRPGSVVRRLRSSHPSCMVFSVDGFVGASPELLVARSAMSVVSEPLAGTLARPPSGEGDEALAPRFLSSTKERREHRLVVDAVAAALSPYCEQLTVPAVPGVVPIGTLAHLGTLITGRLGHQRPTALDLVGAIHPSPAVAGTPTAAALDYIATVEGRHRGRYAGPVGWVDADGDGCFAVGIRSAHIEGRRARLMAGVGILADSDPEAELAETDLKLQPMLGALIRP